VLSLTDNETSTTGLKGKFSVYHAEAVSLLYGEATQTQFTDDTVRNETVIALREKVTVTSDEAVEEHEAFVAIEFQGGKKLEFQVEHSKGSYENRLNSTFLETKFIDQAGRRIGESTH